MKIAISNIAWPVQQDAAVARLLHQLGVRGIEVAPTKVWSSPCEVNDAEIQAYRRSWESWGISIIAAQALLFGRPELTLFENARTREATLAYLRGIIRVCGRLGAKVSVFGSPRNRRLGGRDRATVWQEAIDFFRRLAEVAKAEGTTVGIEANPPAYGADFVTRAAEALELVQAVHHPNFLLHLDTACMTLAEDDPGKLIPKAADVLAHVHASEPHLAPI